MANAPDPIADAAVPIMRHVNGEHTENLIEYLHAFTDVQSATDAKMIGVDHEGFDIEAMTPSGAVKRRIAWGAPLEKREEVRHEMVRLTTEAKLALGLPPPEQQDH